MHIIFIRPSACLALLLAALAFPSPLKAADLEVDVGEAATAIQGYLQVSLVVNYTIAIGCPEDYLSYRLGPDSTSPTTYCPPASNGTIIINVSKTYDVGHSGINAGAEPVDFEFTENKVVQLVNYMGQAVDSQTVSIKIKGKVKLASQFSVPTGTVSATVSLKPGGLSPGKDRVPQLLADAPPAEETQEIGLIADVPNYYIEQGTGRVIPIEPVKYSLAGKQNTFGNGTNMQLVTVPKSAVPSNGSAPGFFSDAFLNAKKVTSDDGRSWYFGTATLNNYTPPQQFETLMLNRGPDGAYNLTALGVGVYGDKFYNFPANYAPLKVNGVPEAEKEDLDFSNIDPCFQKVLENLGVEIPVDQPGETENPPPKGSEVSNPTLPSSGGGGSSGGTGGSGTPIPGPGSTPDPSTGGGAVVQGPSSGGSGDRASEPGGALPGDGDAEKDADAMAKKMSSSLDQIQQKAKRLMEWGKVESFSPGMEGEWTISLPINHRNFNLRIPTEHAPMVRQLLLLVFTGYFIVGVFNLLTK